MNYLENTKPDTKRIQKKINENLKNTRNERPKKFFLSAEYIPQSYIYEYMVEQHEYTLKRIKEIREESLKFLYDDSNIELYGWNDRKPDQKKLDKWVDKAFPNINVGFIESEFEDIVLKRYLDIK